LWLARIREKRKKRKKLRGKRKKEDMNEKCVPFLILSIIEDFKLLL